MSKLIDDIKTINSFNIGTNLTISNSLPGNTESGLITFNIPPENVINYTLTWPSAQGSLDQMLLNDGSGNLAWADFPSSATTGSLVVTGETNLDTLDTSGAATMGSTLNIADNTTIGGTITINNDAIINGTTQSISTGTGALIVSGGVGIAKNLNVGGEVNFTGIVSITDTTESTTTGNGALIVSGGVSIDKGLILGGKLSLNIRTVGDIGTLDDDYILNVNASTNGATITLPDITEDKYNGVAYLVIKTTANNVDLTTQPSDKIIDSGSEVDTISLDGASGERIHVISNGLKWYVI